MPEPVPSSEQSALDPNSSDWFQAAEPDMKFVSLRHSLFLLCCCWAVFFAIELRAQDSNGVPHFDIQGYLVNDTAVSPTNSIPMLSAYTGTNASVDDIVRAASELQAEYAKRGFSSVGIAVGAQDLTNGVVTLHVFQSAIPQIRIAGKRYVASSNEVTMAANLLAGEPTNAAAAIPEQGPHPFVRKPRPLTPEEEALHAKMAEMATAELEARYPMAPPTTQLVFAAPLPPIPTNDVQGVLRQKMSELDEQAKRGATATNAPASTNSGPVFEVKGYELIGNTLLPTNLTETVLQRYIGTNMTFDGIRHALTELQATYRDHGFATVSVTLPQQTLTDKIVKIRVFEGKLVQVEVVNNKYFSSNNVMRALPSLHENMILTAPIFQSELDRANANQDRQIYPAIEPGPVEGTTHLKLDVKDRYPLHGKLDFNNQNSPGTPALRLNTSAEYKNFWQLEHTLGVQYSFSPEQFKKGDQWAAYDSPLVANYSAFYRMPLGNPESVANTINSSTEFGYSEATRRFNLPPPSGQPELNFFASRSTIDTGLERSPEEIIFDVPGVRRVTRQDVQQDITVNNAVGFQFSGPLPENDGLVSTWSAGLNYKSYQLTSAKTNNFQFAEFTVDPNGKPNPPIISEVSSPVPLTSHLLDYVPVNLRYDGSKQDAHGVTSFGVGVSVNAWYSGSLEELQAITGSKRSKGHWVTINPTITHDFYLPKNWTLSLHGEAQWASEPLISNEQFGAGGVSSVRGYHEGEVFGDKGWRLNTELKTPVVVVGMAYGKTPLTVRGSIYMDYSEVSLIDPQTRQDTFPLWSAGAGWVTSIGTHWETRLLFSVPFDQGPSTERMQPRFSFSLIGQF